MQLRVLLQEFIINNTAHRRSAVIVMILLADEPQLLFVVLYLDF